MKIRLTRVFCFLLALVMALSFTACTSCSKDKDKKKKKKDKQEVASSDVIDMEDEELSDFEDIYIDEELLPDDIENFENIEVPMSYYITQSELPGHDIDDGDLGDIIDDPDPGNDNLFYSRIQKNGEAVEGKERVFNVDVDDVVFKDFVGLGTNAFPGSMVPEYNKLHGAKNNNEYDLVSLEVDRKRFMSMKPHYMRMWFQVEYITTTEEADPYREDIENNKDFQNYTNGIYDFDSEEMTAHYPMFDMYKDCGIHVGVNYGWKNHPRISNWWAFPGISNPQASAPYDLDAYAKSCAATMYELYVKRGYTNMDMLTFFNEPFNTYDFLGFVNMKDYFCMMLELVDKELKAKGIRDDIEVWAIEQGSISIGTPHFTDYVYERANQYFDVCTPHYYYGTHGEENDYSTAFDTFAFLHNRYSKTPVYLNEYYTGAYGNIDIKIESNERTLWKDWNDSEASYLIAVANAGCQGMASWGITGGWIPETNNFNVASGFQASWNTPLNETAIKLDEDHKVEGKYLSYGVNANFYEKSLLTNYVPMYSDVLMIDWEGDDVRGAAFKTPDGNYTVVIEANGHVDHTLADRYYAGLVRNLTINFKNNDKDLVFNKFHVNLDTQEVNGHATVNPCEKTINVKAGEALKDTLDKEYGLYVYTTLPPIKQIEIDTSVNTALQEVKELGGIVSQPNSIWFDAYEDDTFDLDAKLIDCENEEIVWSVARTAGADNFININSTTGVITFNQANVTEGSRAAVRASLKSNPDIYDVVIIEVHKR